MVLLLCIFSLNKAKSQDSLYLKDHIFFGLRHYNTQGKVSCFEVEQLYSNIPESLRLYNKSKNNKIISNVVAFTSGFIIGRSIFNNTLSDEAKNTGYVVGGGLFLGALLLESNSKAQLRKAVFIYNKSLSSQTLSHKSIDLKLGLIQDQGLAIVLAF
jgi:hypothetical protein